jgi:integrase
MPLTVLRRKSTGALTISGTVAGVRIQRRAQSNDPKLAREEAAALEAQILRTEWHGERRGSRSFDEALVSYLEAAPRSQNHKARLLRLRDAIGGATRLSAIDQTAANLVKHKVLQRPDMAAPGTYTRAIVMPLRAILRHAADQGWCDPPKIKAPRENKGRTRYLLPEEAERLIEVAAPHIRPLLVFLLGTGARMSEALELDWRDVDLTGGRAIFWETKSGKRRNAALPPRIVAALANLPKREGPVFLRHDRRPYADRERRYGGQIKTSWRTAIRKAGLDEELTPHDLRHSWASWHYALNRDLLALKVEGGWSSVTLVERYAHLLPVGQEKAIRRFLGLCDCDQGVTGRRNLPLTA